MVHVDAFHVCAEIAQACISSSQPGTSWCLQEARKHSKQGCYCYAVLPMTCAGRRQDHTAETCSRKQGPWSAGGGHCERPLGTEHRRRHHQRRQVGPGGPAPSPLPISFHPFCGENASLTGWVAGRQMNALPCKANCTFIPAVERVPHAS